MSERAILTGFAVAMVACVGVAVLALQQAPKTSPVMAVQDLPLPTSWDAELDMPSDCEASGGTIRYDRSSECFSEPDVSDVCGFGVPCFEERDGFYCRDVKDPYCGCSQDEQCGEGWACDTVGQRCYRVAANAISPYPLKPLPIR